MTTWFTATQQFGPVDGKAWRKYVEWSGLTQLTELLSLDPMLCPPALSEIRDDYWPHIVNEDYMLHYFHDLNFLQRQIAGIPRINLLAVMRNPEKEPPQSLAQDFEFVGYDLLDVDNTASALTNCGGFPAVFRNSELSNHGLLTDFRRAMEVKQLLRSLHHEEPHSNCNPVGGVSLYSRGRTWLRGCALIRESAATARNSNVELK